jgi:hypothetical protein
MKDSRPLSVVYYPGCFGRFLLSILQLQKNNVNYNKNDPSSHDIPPLGGVKIIHQKNPTKDEEKLFKNIFPYFPNRYRFLPQTLHYIKFFKDLPTEKNFTKYNIKGFQKSCENQKIFFYKSLVTHFWLCEVKVPKNVYTIDMTELFLNTNKFKSNLENIIQEKLSPRSEELITNKKQLNLPLYRKYDDLVVKTKERFLSGKEEELDTSEDYFKILLLTDIIDYKKPLYNKFLNNFKGQEIKTTYDINKIFI